MAESELQFAMRETQGMIRRPHVGVILLAIDVVLGIVARVLDYLGTTAPATAPDTDSRTHLPAVKDAGLLAE